MNDEIIMRKQEENTILIYSHIPYIFFQPFFILFPCKQIVEMIQKAHIKTSTLGRNQQFAFVWLLLLLLFAVSITAVRHRFGCFADWRHEQMNQSVEVRHLLTVPLARPCINIQITLGKKWRLSTTDQSHWAVWSPKEHLVWILRQV